MAIIGQKTGALIDKDGGLILLAEINGSTFTPSGPTSGTTAQNLGFIKSSDVSQEATVETYEDETGSVIDESETYKLGTKGVLMQSDKALTDYVRSYVKGKTFLEVKYLGYDRAAAKYLWHFQIGRVVAQDSKKRPGGASSTPYEFVNIALASAVTFSATFLASFSVALSILNFYSGTAVTIPVTDRYYLGEA